MSAGEEVPEGCGEGDGEVCRWRRLEVGREEFRVLMLRSKEERLRSSSACSLMVSKPMSDVAEDCGASSGDKDCRGLMDRAGGRRSGLEEPAGTVRVGSECVRSMGGAVTGLVAERVRRWLHEYGERFRGREDSV